MKNKKIHIYYLQQAEPLPEVVFQQFLGRLPEVFQKEIQAYKHRESAQASLLGKIVLIHALQKNTIDLSIHDLQIGEKERPFFNREIDVNISHSGNYVMVALVEQARVGLDIEKHRPLDIQLFKKYFDAYEWDFIQLAKDPLQAFFSCWVLKESAIKCDGRGVEILGQTHVLPNVFSNAALLNISCADQPMFAQLLFIEEKYACSVCCDAPFEIGVTALAIDQLID